MDEITAGLTEMEQEEFLDDVAMGFCPECGTQIIPNRRGRPKKFCSESCRFAWKNKHPKPENWKSSRTAVCPVCGKEFIASREYQRERKYCSRACANRGRAAEAARAVERRTAAKALPDETVNKAQKDGV